MKDVREKEWNHVFMRWSSITKWDFGDTSVLHFILIEGYEDFWGINMEHDGNGNIQFLSEP